MLQWNRGLWGLSTVRQMRNNSDFVWDTENKARYYRRVNIVNAVDELEERRFATQEQIIKQLENYRLLKHLSLHALDMLCAD